MTNEQAIRWLKALKANEIISGVREALDIAIKALEEDRPQGEWIDRMADKGYVECPFCHKQITGGDLNFCVKCGADMRGEEKETKNED